MKPETLRPFKAVISPCSRCENSNSDGTKGFPACPRRLKQLQKQEFDNGGDSADPPDYLLTKTSIAGQELSNPVYDAENQVVAVWVAALANNRGTWNTDGTLAAGSILDPGFDTRYIRCESLPATPNATWAALVAGGAYKEDDQVLVTPMRDEQETFSPDGPLGADSLQTRGVCQKLDLPFSFPMTSPQTDRIPSGV